MQFEWISVLTLTVSMVGLCLGVWLRTRARRQPYLAAHRQATRHANQVFGFSLLLFTTAIVLLTLWH